MDYGPDVLDQLRAVLERRAPREFSSPAGRSAGVLVPLFLRDGEIHVVLTRKTDHLRRHSGEVSFPGGGREPQDATLQHTALREAFEETAIHPPDVDVLGALDDMPTASGAYVMRPYVGVIPYPYELVPEPFEVARILTPPLARFADRGRMRVDEWEHEGVRYPVYFFEEVDGELVWGATARVLFGLVELIEGRDPQPIWTRRA